MTTSVYFLRLRNFLFYPGRTRSEWGFVAIRIVLAYLWLDTVIPRWIALAAGRPEANGLAVRLFGEANGLPVTYFVTVLETLAAVALLFGFLTRFAALWGVIEFSITGATGWTLPAGPTHITGSFGLLKDFALMGLALTLFLNGSLALSLDGYIGKRRRARAPATHEAPLRTS
jgi:uncharacterized membrane protein YphA (DoxX/SURF4 family)